MSVFAARVAPNPARPVCVGFRAMAVPSAPPLPGLLGTPHDVSGTGPDALLLPALSSISTRAELAPLAAILRHRLRCTVPDWPGFGAHPRDRVTLRPATLRRFLDAVLADPHLGRPRFALGLAAGHAAPYLIEAAIRHPGRFERLALVAPTWRGPLPTMFDGGRPLLRAVLRRAVALPVLGQALYRLNVSRPVLAHMMRAHVFADPGAVSEALLANKRAVVRQPRARFATAAFVTGALDPAASRDDFLRPFAASGLPPVLVLRPAGAPKRSGAEMDALAATGMVRTATVPGALAAHEEHPAAVADAVLRFLDG